MSRRSSKKKKLEWQVKAHVVEARDLKGREEGGMSDPVCVVECFDKKQTTTIHKKTLNCVFDQVFFFTAKMYEEEMMNKTISFSVFDANTIKRNVLIGAYTFTLNFAYEKEGHEAYRQWVALVDSTGEFAGVQGYALLSLFVYGPGDEPLDHDEAEEDEGELDLQSMVLMPPEIKTEEYFLKVKCFNAEDLPKMDSWGLCDPYVQVTFAGNPPCKTTVLHKTLEPRWNEELRLPVTLPSMSDSVLVQLLDHDVADEDDVIATQFFSFQEIRNGKYTGPMYVNFYGAPKKARSSNPVAKDMNTGRLQGTTYRGRVLLGLAAEKASDPKMGVASISEPVEPKTDRYMLRFDLHQAVELNTTHDVVVEIVCGPQTFTSSFVPCKKHCVEWYEQLPDETLILPKDRSQIPDIFIVVSAKARIGRQKDHIGFCRLTAADAYAVEAAPTWITLMPDIMSSLYDEDTLPGFLLCSLSFFSTTVDAVPSRAPLSRPLTKPYEFRCHLYQGIDISAADPNGLSDPYIICRCGSAEQKSSVRYETCYPQWYETIRFDIDLPDDHSIAPDVQLLLYDWDKHGADDFLGRFHVSPHTLHPEFDVKPKKYPLTVEAEADEDSLPTEGEVLASFQLVPVDRGNEFPPPEIEPKFKDCFAEISLIGLRNLIPPDVWDLKAPYVEFDCGNKSLGEVVRSKASSHPESRNPNFVEVLKLQCRQPLNPKFASVITVRAYDGRSLGTLSECGSPIPLSSRYYWNTGGDALIGVGSINAAPLLPWSSDAQKGDGLESESDSEVEPTDKPADDKPGHRDSVASSLPHSDGDGDVKAEATLDSLDLSVTRRRGKRDKKLKTRKVKKPVAEKKDDDKASDTEGAEEGEESEYESEEESEDEAEVDEKKPLLGDKEKEEAVKIDVAPKFEHEEIALGQDPSDQAEEEAKKPYKKELENLLDDMPFKEYPLFIGKTRGLSKLEMLKKKNAPVGGPTGQEGTRKAAGLLKAHVRFIMRKKEPAKFNLKELYVARSLKLRVYILRGLDLIAKDEDGFSDPYICLSVGKKKRDQIKDTDNIHKKTLNPQFYHMYEMDIKLPGQSMLTVQVWDWDRTSSDDLIGETKIDLETRWFSPKWTDMTVKPTETRTLWSPSSSSPQGKLEMFLEIMTPEEAMANPPKQIGPPPPKNFDFRVIIWDTEDVAMKDKSGDKGSSDVYISGQLGENNKGQQKTDIHWKCDDGKALFNWRMVWPVVLPLENSRFRIQIWDKDIVGKNDAIGEASVNLAGFFRGAYKADAAKLLDRQWLTLTHPNFEGPQGKVQVTFEALPEDLAKERECGLGRKEPNQYPHLPKPDRPETAMNPFAVHKRFGNWAKNAIFKKMAKRILIGVAASLFSYLTFAFFTGNFPFNA